MESKKSAGKTSKNLGGRPKGRKTDPAKLALRKVKEEENRKQEMLAEAQRQNNFILNADKMGPEEVLAGRLPLIVKSNTKYTPELAAHICLRVAEGETLTSVCKQLGIQPNTFRSWVIAYPELKDAWEAARKIKASSLFDEALDIARDLKDNRHDNVKVTALRVATDTLKWAAAKLSPQEYGDKLPDKPFLAIQINTGLDLGQQAKQTVAAPGLFSYSIQASLPEPPASVEIISDESAQKSAVPAKRKVIDA